MKKKIKVQVEEEIKVNNKFTNPLLGVKFWLFTIASALLIAVGIWLLVDKTLAASLAVGFTGIVICLFGLIRVIPLFKARKGNMAKFVTILEIVINVLLGLFLIYAATIIKKEDNVLGDFVTKYYRFFLGFAFYLKSIFYFINTSLLKEETNKFEFWVHILIITIAVVIFATNFDASNLAIFIAILSLICGVFLIGMAGGSYFNYRKTINKKPKKVKEEKENIEENKEEELILPTNDEKNNETYVN